MNETNPLDQDNFQPHHNETINASYTTVETESNKRVEEFSINGDSLFSKLQELVKQGNIRKIVVKNQESKVLFELPLTFGVVGGTLGTFFFPFAAILAGVGILAARLTIVIEKDIA